MCRHVAYVGEPIRLGELLVDPPHSLATQAWRPRRQDHGTMNVDGFGVGWYVPGIEVPARHRGTGPLWADETFADLARVVRAPALMAAVRSATPGMAAGAGAAAPFRRSRWLFSHNGAIKGWPEAARALAEDLPTPRWLDLDVVTDSALLWALVLERLETGASPTQALAGTVRRALAVVEGRFTLLLTEGTEIAAVVSGTSLGWRCDPRGLVVGSEPADDEPGWQEVPDRCLLTGGPQGVSIAPL